MKKVLEIIAKVAQWCGFGFFLLLAIGIGFHISSLFFLIAAVMIMPITPIKKVYEKIKFRTWMVALIIVGLLFFGAAFAPESEPAETPGGETSVTEQDKTDENEESAETPKQEEQVERTETEDESDVKEEDSVDEQTTPNETPEQTQNTLTVTTPEQTTPSTDSSQIKTSVQTPVEEETPNEQPENSSSNNENTGDTDNDDSNGTVVYRTPSGKRYHLDPQCGGANSYEVTMSAALNSGLTACQKCAM